VGNGDLILPSHHLTALVYLLSNFLLFYVRLVKASLQPGKRLVAITCNLYLPLENSKASALIIS